MLATGRLLNLIYHWRVRDLTPESRAEVDNALRQAGELNATEQPSTPTDNSREAQQARHIPGTAPRWIRPPSWWKGDRAAWQNSIRAGQELGEPAAKGISGIPAAAPPALGMVG